MSWPGSGPPTHLQLQLLPEAPPCCKGKETDVQRCYKVTAKHFTFHHLLHTTSCSGQKEMHGDKPRTVCCFPFSFLLELLGISQVGDEVSAGHKVPGVELSLHWGCAHYSCAMGTPLLPPGLGSHFPRSQQTWGGCVHGRDHEM